MKRQEEYELRNKIHQKISNKIRMVLDNYFKTYEYNPGYLIFYPLANIEESFITKPEEFMMKFIKNGLITDQRMLEFMTSSFYKSLVPERYATAWFLKEMIKRKGKLKQKFVFRTEEYEEFKKIVPTIVSLHKDWLKAEAILLMRTIGKITLDEEDHYITMKCPSFSDDYNKDNVYYYGDDNPQKREEELEIIRSSDQYLITKFPYHNDIMKKDLQSLLGKMKKVDNLKSAIDIELYNRCIRRVNIDLDKLGTELKTDIISSKEELSKILGFFYYISLVHHFKLSIKNSCYMDFTQDITITFSYEKLIVKISEVTKLNRKVVERYIEYFNLKEDTAGGFNEMPLLIHRNDVSFIPSSFIFNDFQFSIVTGHYYKNVNVHLKDKTISESIVNDVCNHFMNYENISVVKEVDYYDNEHLYNGNKIVSDIDVGIYDKLSNTILIIECKWKENLYRPHEDFLKIEKAVNEIYREQLGKHKFYINMNSYNINNIFNSVPELNLELSKLNIEYIFVDKRIQYHDQDKHVLPVFVLQSIANEFSEDGNLYLDKVVDKIRSLRTEIKYNDIETYREFKIDEYNIKDSIFEINYEEISDKLLIEFDK